ncbi:MAG: GNAT family N-acetyltransferase [Patescibacteria group bacterium]
MIIDKHIQLAKIKDIDQIASILKNGYLFSYISDKYSISLENIEKIEFIEKAKSIFKPYKKTWVYKVGREIQGFVTYKFKNNVSEISKLYINKQYQGKGLGKILFEQAIVESVENTDIIVYVINYNIRACKFYEKMGFELIMEEDNSHELLTSKFVGTKKYILNKEKVKMIKKIYLHLQH